MNGVGYLPGQAPGAIPNGTRIRKSASEDGDVTPIGTQGNVLASHEFTPEMLARVRRGSPGTPDTAFLYFVEWDNHWRGLPIAIADWKIEEAS